MTDEIGGGIFLGEAFRRSISKTRWDKFKALEAYKAPKNRLSDPPPDYDNYHNRYHQLFATLWGPLQQRLCSGELIATAYEGAYTGLHCQREVIPAEVWEFAEPDFEKSEASGGVLPFTRIKIFRASELQSIALPGNRDVRELLPDQPVSKQRIQMFANGGVLIIDGKKHCFRGVAHKKVIAQLFRTLQTGEPLLTREVLRNANTEVDAFAKLFSRNPHWKELKQVLRQENGYCWLEI